MKRIITLLVVLAALTGGVFAQSLNVMTEENAPFNFTDGSQVKGIAVDLLLEMASRGGVDISRGDVQVLPWARSYQAVQDEAGALLFSMGRTESREDLFDWVGPIYGLQIGVIAKKSSNITADTVQDLSGYSIGTVREGAPEQLYLGQGGDVSNLDRGTDLESNLRKLEAGRIDAVAWNVPSALYNLSLLGENPDDYEVIYVLKALDLYYAFNKGTGGSATSSLQSALNTMRNDGSYDEIVSTYLK